MFTIGAFGIIFDTEGRVLLCHRRDMDLWNLPGGGMESGELPTTTVIREVREETGLEIQVERLVGVYAKPDKDDLVFAFTCQAIGGTLTETDEADICRYFPLASIPANTAPKHVERIWDAVNCKDVVYRIQTAPSGR